MDSDMQLLVTFAYSYVTVTQNMYAKIYKLIINLLYIHTYIISCSSLKQYHDLQKR